MLHKKIFLFITFFITFFGNAIKDANADIIVSLKPLGFIAMAIADGITPVQVLLPDGVSAHDYYLRPSDIQRLQNAELVIWIGPEMETFMLNSLKKIPQRKKIQITTLKDVQFFLAKEDNKDRYICNFIDFFDKKDKKCYQSKKNMHLWLSPDIAWISAIAIHKKMIELSPKNKEKLNANLKDFKKQLYVTNKIVLNQLTSLKEEKYYAFHNAYRYYEKYYGLTPTGYFSVNPNMQPSIQQLYKIRIQLINKKITCIVSELQCKQAILSFITKGISVRTGILDPFGTNIQLGKQSYSLFLMQSLNQYISCLNKQL